MSVTWMCLAAARALRSSLRAAMPLKAAWMVTAEADSRVPLAPCKRGRHTLEAGAREVDKIWKLWRHELASGQPRTVELLQHVVTHGGKQVRVMLTPCTC